MTLTQEPSSEVSVRACQRNQTTTQWIMWNHACWRPGAFPGAQRFFFFLRDHSSCLFSLPTCPYKGAGSGKDRKLTLNWQTAMGVSQEGANSLPIFLRLRPRGALKNPKCLWKFGGSNRRKMVRRSKIINEMNKSFAFLSNHLIHCEEKSYYVCLRNET